MEWVSKRPLMLEAHPMLKLPGTGRYTCSLRHGGLGEVQYNPKFSNILRKFYRVDGYRIIPIPGRAFSLVGMEKTAFGS